MSSNSSKTVLETLEPAKVKSRETSKQGITMTPNKNVCSQKNSITCVIPSESLHIPDMNKTNHICIPDFMWCSTGADPVTDSTTLGSVVKVVYLFKIKRWEKA